MISTLGYDVTEQLYESASSLVYQARRQADNLPVILKLLKGDYPPPRKVASFQREYTLLHDLNVPGVIKVHALERDQHALIIVMEDIGGRSLAELSDGRAMSVAEFLPLAIRIVEIVGAVHQKHVIHKDINPANIVFNPATNEVRLIDFGISTVLSRENPTLRNPNVLEGTLSYISPEQTGRMNRGVDYRTDFYSLGVTFFELLTGTRPFSMTDAMGLVHAHIAQPPPPPHHLNGDIPVALSSILLKMMEKSAEDRYQSAHGIRADLEACLQQVQAGHSVAPFPLARHDVSDWFQLPQTLYGREREREALLATFRRISQGASEVTLVTGYAGVGKSSLVQELYSPITEERGFFLSGKFDQFQRNIPYSGLLQAFRSLVRYLLTEDEAGIARWRTALTETLGANGQVMVEVIPEIELILGPQPPVPDLPPTEAQNRFNLVFQNFIELFTRPEHPLVLFLDDLQWADAASLTLLETLLATPEREYLLLIGAYRDNEVGSAHPLHPTIEAIRRAGTPVNRLALEPLALPHILALLQDALHAAPESLAPLAELLQRKTQGNPFFMGEFLKSLHAHHLLTFDHTRGAWQWDMEALRREEMTDNVVALLAEKVEQLPDESQRLLRLAACIGNQFDLETLAVVSEQARHEVAADLWVAITEELILPLDDDYQLVALNVAGLDDAEYRFAHDRIQQAVYSLIPEEERRATHWRVGQLLLRNRSAEEQEQRLFDIVNHLNQGQPATGDELQTEELVRLNLRAGQRANGSAAYGPASEYLAQGLALLGKSGWDEHHELALALHTEAAEAAYLHRDFERMDRMVEEVIARSTTLMDQARAYESRLRGYFSQVKLLPMVDTALQVLKLLGVSFPAQPTQEDVYAAMQNTWGLLAGRQPAELATLPPMSDPVKLAAMRILMFTTPTSYMANPNLFPLIVLKQLDLSLEYGNATESAFGYATYGMMLCSFLGDAEQGYQFGQLALKLLEHPDAKPFTAKVLLVTSFHVGPWKIPIKETLTPLLTGYRSALETGDFQFAAMNGTTYCIHAYLMGQELPVLLKEMEQYGAAIEQIKEDAILHWHHIFWQPVLNLMGRTDSPSELRGPIYDAASRIPAHIQSADFSSVFNAYFSQLMLYCFFQEWEKAVATADQVDAYIGNSGGCYLPISRFYDSLARLGTFMEADSEQQQAILEKVTATQERMHQWAQHAPANYLHKYHLVEAELARVTGRDAEAQESYNRAIDLARENEYLHEEALAYELAGHFYLSRGQTQLAQYFLRDAHYAYLRWGALAKVRHLEATYPQYLAPATRSTLSRTLTATTTSTEGFNVLDFISVLKASQAISGEIELERLLVTLMKIVVENGGAQVGYFILDKEGQWVVEAMGQIGSAEVTTLQSAPIDTMVDGHTLLPTAIINYVVRTRDSVVLADATRQGAFTNDPYVLAKQPRSVLCAPLVNQGNLNGILYLENNLIPGVFTPDRLEVLNFLSSQAAISIENANLYSSISALNRAYERFVPRQFLGFLEKKSITEVRLGDQVQKEMTVLFSDIRDFTAISERMTPEENFQFLNNYLGRMEPHIAAHSGFIDKYIGDGIMALFPTNADNALNGAVAMLNALQAYNEERQTTGREAIQIGIGLHTGLLMMGTIGGHTRMDGTVISDAVNLASRVEDLTKYYGASLLITEQTYQRLTDPQGYAMRELSRVRVKGKLESVRLYEVFEGDAPAIRALKVESQADFAQAVTLYRQGDLAGCQALFNQVLKRNPHDRAAQLYLERCDQLQATGLPLGWEGVEVLEIK